MRQRVVLWGLGGLVSTGLVLTMASASPAAAIDPASVQTVVVGGPSTAVLPLQVDQLYPGIGTHARFVVRRGASWLGGSFAATVTDLEDVERGCNRPEQNAGDVTCGDGTDQGELSQQLLVNASWTEDVASCASASVPSGGTAMRLARDLPFTAASGQASDDLCLVVAVHLPVTADNLVQSDLVRFGLRIGLEDAVLDGSPGQVAAGRVQSAAGSPSAFPSTGATPTPPTSSSASAPVGGVAQLPAQSSPSAAADAGAVSTAPGSTSPATAALVRQPRALPFTGGQPLLLVGWACLLVFAGWVAVQAARTRRATPGID